MDDYLVKALVYSGQVRAYAARTTKTVGEAQRRHSSWPTASAALGRTLTAGLMLGAMLKGEESLTIRIEGGGPLGAILTDVNAKGALISLGKKELEDIMETEGQAEALCHFCNEKYLFSKEELAKLNDEAQ